MPKIKYKYDRARAIRLLTNKMAYSDWNLAQADVARTKTFIEAAFDDYQGLNKLDQVEFAFCLPTRASRFEEQYWPEVYDFFPALKHLDIHYRFAILACLPPQKIEMYGKPGEAPHGVVIFVPIFTDMPQDYLNKLWLKREVVKRINQATNLAHEKMGAKYIGLGAMLPKLTNFGRKITTNAVITTGHGGTVWLMQETLEQVIDKYFNGKSAGLNIGFIGAGSIGMAALENIGSKHKSSKYWVYDIRPKMNQDAKQKLASRGINLGISKSNDDLIDKCDIILSAITSKIAINGKDLSGKVIIDDSQPGQFDRQEVEAAGGVLVWVVGHDNSDDSFTTRRSGYSYGSNGLHSPGDLWGCEAEVAAIANQQRPDLAISNDVTPEQVEQIGQVFKKMKLQVAEFQSYGQLNDK